MALQCPSTRSSLHLYPYCFPHSTTLINILIKDFFPAIVSRAKCLLFLRLQVEMLNIKHTFFFFLKQYFIIKGSELYC